MGGGASVSWRLSFWNLKLGSIGIVGKGTLDSAFDLPKVKPGKKSGGKLLGWKGSLGILILKGNLGNDIII